MTAANLGVPSSSWQGADYLARLANSRLNTLESLVAAQGAYTLIYTDETARLAATGFTAADVGRIAWQQSDNTFWQLTDYSPITWVEISGATAIPAHAAGHLPGGADALATGVPVPIGTTNTEGSAAAFARQDHVHALPALAPDPSGTWNSVTVDARGLVVGGVVVPVSLTMQDAYDEGDGSLPTVLYDATRGGLILRDKTADGGLGAAAVLFAVEGPSGTSKHLQVLGSGETQFGADLRFLESGTLNYVIGVATPTVDDQDAACLSLIAGSARAGGAAGHLYLTAGSVVACTDGTPGNVYVQAGSADGSTLTGGSVYLRAAAGAGENGSLYLGDTDTDVINIGPDVVFAANLSHEIKIADSAIAGNCDLTLRASKGIGGLAGGHFVAYGGDDPGHDATGGYVVAFGAGAAAGGVGIAGGTYKTGVGGLAEVVGGASTGAFAGGGVRVQPGKGTTNVYGAVSLAPDGGNVVLGATHALYGGTAATDYLKLVSTSGVGTTDYISLCVGTNGGTEGLRVIDSGKVGIGEPAPSQALDLIGSLELQATTSSTTGVIYKGADRFIHDYKPAANVGNNVFFGVNAGNFTMGGPNAYQGSYNVGIGVNSLYSNSTGSYNVGIGVSSLQNNSTGSYNVGIGVNSLYTNLTGSSNVGIGVDSLQNNSTGSYNVGIGVSSLRSNSTGYYNVGVGVDSLYSNSTGSYNVGIGVNSLYTNSTGANNCAQGMNALANNTTGNNNCAQGYGALVTNTTGNSNCAQGSEAGRYIQSGAGLTIANNSIFLGYNTRALADNSSNEIVIGASAIGAGDNSVVLGNDSITKTILKGSVGLGTSSPGYLLTAQKAGTAKANLDILGLVNSGNAADMDGTATSLLFRQYYYDAVTPAAVDAARITVGTETDWTSTASTQDAYMAFSVAVDGVVYECGRFESGGWLKLNASTTPQTALLLDIAAPAASGAEVLRNSHIIDLRGRMHDLYDAQFYGDWQFQARPVTSGTGHATLNFSLSLNGVAATDWIEFGYAGGLGVFGHAAPTSQPAYPADLDAVKNILMNAGFCAGPV